MSISDSLALSEGQRALQDSLRGFLADQLSSATLRSRLDTEPGYDPQLHSRLTGQRGLAGLTIPAEFGGLGVSFRRSAADVEASDAAVEPEAGDVGHVGDGDLRVKVEQDANVVAAGFVDEVVEIVEGAVGGVDGLSVGGVGLDGGEEEDIGAEGLDIFEALGDAVETAAAGGVKVEGVHFVDDSLLPPDVGVDAVADPSGTGEGLGFEV